MNQSHQSSNRVISYFAAMALGLAGAANLHAQTFVDTDVGTPRHAGSVSIVNGVLTENGGGNDIWNQSDNFHYYYTAVAGDFDCIVRVQSLTGPDTWSKAELMVQESVADSSGNLVPAGGDRFFANMATQAGGQNGVAAQWRETPGGWATWNGWPDPMIYPGYPNCWLRMQRVGDLFFASYSPDGANWNLYANTYPSQTPSKPFNPTVLVGLAVTAHNDSDPFGATAVFSNFQILNPPPPANFPSSVAVKALTLWTPTGLLINRHDTLCITASGAWNYWNGTVPGLLGPQGDPNNPAPWDLFFSGALHGALIAFIGSDPYQGHWRDGGFFPQSIGYWNIGECAQITSDRSGTLWLGVNDDAVSGGTGDNVGAVTAQIRLGPCLDIACPANVEVIAGLCAPSAVVNYSVPTVTEYCGTCGTPEVSGSPASGASFALGTTTVICTAVDSCHQASCAFTVTVVTPQQATQLIIGIVTGLVSQGALNAGQGNALIVKLQAAVNSMNRCQGLPACNQLGALLNQVQAFIRVGMLTPAQGQPLIDAANQVRTALNCQ